jgi:hypothetical protein
MRQTTIYYSLYQTGPQRWSDDIVKKEVITIKVKDAITNKHRQGVLCDSDCCVTCLLIV